VLFKGRAAASVVLCFPYKRSVNKLEQRAPRMASGLELIMHRERLR